MTWKVWSVAIDSVHLRAPFLALLDASILVLRSAAHLLLPIVVPIVSPIVFPMVVPMVVPIVVPMVFPRKVAVAFALTTIRICDGNVCHILKRWSCCSA